MNKLLFVEDDPVIREVMPILLARIGYDVTAVDSCEAGLIRVNEAHLDGAPFKIVITDGYLGPGMMGGIEFITHLRADPENKMVTIALFSGNNDDYHRQAMAAGANKAFRKDTGQLTAWAESFLAEG